MTEPRLIKRYSNRKLYDASQSAYVTFNDVTKMIQAGEDVKIIDNKTKNDITGVTLTQLLYEGERKTHAQPPIGLLKEIILHGDASFSGYIQSRLAGELARFESEDDKTAVSQ